MVLTNTPSDIERATKRKTAVNMSPSWVFEEGFPWDYITQSEGEESKPNIHSTAISTIESCTTMLSSTSSLPRTPCSITSNSSIAPRWSDFIRMNNISIMSKCNTIMKQERTSESSIVEMNAKSLEPLEGTFNQTSLRRHYSARISKTYNFDTNDEASEKTPTTDSSFFCGCVCNHPAMGSLSRHRFSISGLSVGSRRHYQKLSLELGRGYPTGQCVSSLDPPPNTKWDEGSSGNSIAQELQSSIKTNTAFNFETFKMFLSSLFFSNILKCLIIIVSGLIFATALDAITILRNNLGLDNISHISSVTICLLFTTVFSILTIIYACFTIALESARPPEGMDASYSKPMIVIFSEIMTSIIWAQVMSVTTFIYLWTFECMFSSFSQEKGFIDLWVIEELGSIQQAVLVGNKMCHREGAMVGLEVLLVFLLILNLYTHLAQNFRFIWDIER